jgi:geranylgeranyl pyrophosphate synthase
MLFPFKGRAKFTINASFFFFFYNFRIYISYLIDSNNLIHIINLLSPSVLDFFNDAISKTVGKQNLDNNFEEQTEEN